MKVVFVIIGVVVIISMFGLMVSGIKSAQTTERTDTFITVTAGGDFDSDVVLVGDLYEDELLNVTEITSDIGGDAPLPHAYNPITRTLTIDGLAASETHTLAVTYLYGSLTGSASSASTFLGLIPLLVGIGTVILVVAAIIAAVVLKR